MQVKNVKATGAFAADRRRFDDQRIRAIRPLNAGNRPVARFSRTLARFRRLDTKLNGGIVGEGPWAWQRRGSAGICIAD